MRDVHLPTVELFLPPRPHRKNCSICFPSPLSGSEHQLNDCVRLHIAADGDLQLPPLPPSPVAPEESMFHVIHGFPTVHTFRVRSCVRWKSVFPNFLAIHCSTYLTSLCEQRPWSMASHSSCNDWNVLLRTLVPFLHFLCITYLSLANRCRDYTKAADVETICTRHSDPQSFFVVHVCQYAHVAVEHQRTHSYYVVTQRIQQLTVHHGGQKLLRRMQRANDVQHQPR